MFRGVTADTASQTLPEDCKPGAHTASGSLPPHSQGLVTSPKPNKPKTMARRGKGSGSPDSLTPCVQPPGTSRQQALQAVLGALCLGATLTRQPS